MSDLYEIRDYHYDGDLAGYEAWWRESNHVLARHCDIVGVWFASDQAPQVSGADPMRLPHGSANVTWIIRWRDMDHRNANWSALGQDPEWAECRTRHPGFDRYLHMSARFMTSLD